MGRWLRWRDGLALLLLAGSLIASLVVWDYGRVNIGMTVEADTQGHSSPPGIVVGTVVQDGNAARLGINPFWPVIDLTTTDGGEVERGEPIGVDGGWVPITPPGSVLVSFLFGQGGEIRLVEEDHRPPAEPVASERIETAMVGFADSESLLILGSIDRSALESRLAQSIWIAVLGLMIGGLVWFLLARWPIPSAIGRENALLLGTAAAVPFVLVPLLQVGTPLGIVVGFLVPLAVALILGISLAFGHEDSGRVRAAIVGSTVAAGTAGLLVARYMTQTYPEPNVRGGIIALVGAVALVPAAVATTGISTRRARSAHVSLALVPVAAMTVMAPGPFDPLLAALLLSMVIGWQFLPVDRLATGMGDAVAPVRSRRFTVEPPRDPVLVALRDAMTYALLGLTAVIGLVQFNTWAAIGGLGFAAAAGLALKWRLLGTAWTDAAVPVAGAVGLPIMLLGFPMVAPVESLNPFVLSVALTSLAVAHVVASRHSNPEWRWRLLLGSVGVVVLAVGLSLVGDPAIALVLLALIPLVPGVPAALAEGPGEPATVPTRLETLAVAITPGIAATVLVTDMGGFLLGAWLVAVVVWRRFTLAPLVGFARRTQLQRDVAVAAAETERARLAADLHDDALQQLTMLVRTLDEGGHKEAANEAREIATKLRSVVGDLRLPILDDLGAGAALEWLVERVEPLAGGPVKLERSDETRPPANVELAVFRVAQEALTNAIKHGKAPIAVRYDVRTDGRVTLAIDDAGEGIGSAAAEDAPNQGHFGLLNMQQRAEQIGALLDVRRWPAGGTRVALEWRPQ